MFYEILNNTRKCFFWNGWVKTLLEYYLKGIKQE